MLHRHGRPPGPLVPAEDGKQRMLPQPLDIRAALALLEAWDAERADLDKVLLVEAKVFKVL